MTNKMKQNRVLYICLIILLVSASVLIAIASASNKARVGVDDGKATVKDQNEPNISIGDVKPEIPENDAKNKDEAPESEDASGKNEPMQSVSLTINDIRFVSPADGAVISGYSLSVPVYSLTMNDYRTHNGVDIVTESAASVRACADGEVVSMGYNPMMGMSVRISHGAGVESVYRNLAEDLAGGLKVGSKVAAGDVIGTVGDTALIECEEEPHLHFELAVNGENVDPLDFVKLSLVSESYED